MIDQNQIEGFFDVTANSVCRPWAGWVRKVLAVGVFVAPAPAVAAALTDGQTHTQTTAGEPVAVAVTRDDPRHPTHPAKPNVPQPQKPAQSTPENVDTHKPFIQWDHLTGDWGGARPWLDDHGITMDASITADWSSNWRGGTNTNGSSFRHLFLFDLTIDTERLFGLKGGTLFMDFQNHNGEDGSEDTGDFQAYSNIDADGRTEIAELWYEQVLLDGKLRVKFGKVEANAEYAYVDHGAEFIHSSMGVSPTIFVLPTYPDPAMSLNIFVYPTEHLYFGVGLFDGALQEGVTTGSRGPKTFFESSPADMFVIGEAGVTWGIGEQPLPGRLAVGGWGHNGSFMRFDGSGTEDGTAGFYLVLDQTLWRERPDEDDDNQGVGVFFQIGWADEEVSEAELHLGTGVVWVGAIPTRDQDAMGVGVAWVKFTDEPGAGFTDDSETAVELFYKIQLLNWLSIKPDVQYIANPGGADLKDALVGTLRVDILF